MIIQRINRTNPEKVFVVVRNDHTATLTKGRPVVYKFDGTRDGLDVEDTVTGTAAKNHLVAGLADKDIAAGDYGLAQCYGVRTDAVILKCGIASSDNGILGDAMVLATAISALSGVATGAISGYFPGFILGETMASSAATATTTATVFIRLV